MRIPIERMSIQSNRRRIDDQVGLGEYFAQFLPRPKRNGVIQADCAPQSIKLGQGSVGQEQLARIFIQQKKDLQKLPNFYPTRGLLNWVGPPGESSILLFCGR